MVVRVLLVLAALAVLYGCGQASSPAEKQGGVAETEPKAVSDGCLGQYRSLANPEYSPDGQKILFISTYLYPTPASVPGSASGPTAAPGTDPSEADDEICVVNADGTGTVNLTSNSDPELVAAWSPDGTKVAFVRYEDYDAAILVMNADGSNETGLQHAPNVNALSWSPDGQEIAFSTRVSGRSVSSREIRAVRADGSGTPKKLTSAPVYRAAQNPAWSPDGKWIAFKSDRDNPPHSYANGGDIYVMRIGDPDQWRQLTYGSANDDHPAWSPDGTEIAFDRTDARGGTPTIYKVNTYDGSNETYLAAGSVPTWTPDGKHIAYGGLGGLYKMNSDGSEQTLIVDDRP